MYFTRNLYKSPLLFLLKTLMYLGEALDSDFLEYIVKRGVYGEDSERNRVGVGLIGKGV